MKTPVGRMWLLVLVLGHVAAAWVAFTLGVAFAATSTSSTRHFVEQGRDRFITPPCGAASASKSSRTSERGGGETVPDGVDNRGGVVGDGRDGTREAVDGWATVPTDDFLEAFASGFPWHMFSDGRPTHGASQVLLLNLDWLGPQTGTATAAAAAPRHYNSTRDAFQGGGFSCRQVRQVVTRSALPRAKVSMSSYSCLAVVPSRHSFPGTDTYLLQKWMNHHHHHHRGAAAARNNAGATGIDPAWHAVGRYQFAKSGSNTLEDLPLSKKRDLAAISRNELTSYLRAIHRDDAMQRLQDVADRVAMAGPAKVRGTVMVLTVNSGHVDLFVNFVCAARAAKIDLNKLLLVATDEVAFQVAVGLGIAAYYDPDIFAAVPVAAAQVYGDGVYGKIMMSKAYCAHLLSMTGHDFLFQDVDIIPYNSNYLEWWIDLSKESGYDLVFQNDFSSRVDYAPWSANSGCYFAANNARTRYFFADMAWRGDSILKTRSHQAPLHAALSDHASLFGLRVRTLADETSSLLPMGYHFHRRPGMFRDPLFKNKAMSLHMNWNQEKTSKRLFLEQMGDWHVGDGCLGGPSNNTSGAAAAAADLDGQGVPSIDTCCVDHPAAICHYRDVPSVKSCDSSPALRSKPGAGAGDPGAE